MYICFSWLLSYRRMAMVVAPSAPASAAPLYPSLLFAVVAAPGVLTDSIS